MHRWKTDETDFAFSTWKELKAPHCSVPKPFLKARKMLFGRAGRPSLETKTAKPIEEIQEDCRVCPEFPSSLRRFKISVGTEGLIFNHWVQVHTIFRSSRPVIHVVAETTLFCAALFLHQQWTTEIWKSIQHRWTLVYLASSLLIFVVHRGSSYTSKDMKGTVKDFEVCLAEAPIATPRKIRVVKRYPAPSICNTNEFVLTPIARLVIKSAYYSKYLQPAAPWDQKFYVLRF